MNWEIKIFGAIIFIMNVSGITEYLWNKFKVDERKAILGISTLIAFWMMFSK